MVPGRSMKKLWAFVTEQVFFRAERYVPAATVHTCCAQLCCLRGKTKGFHDRIIRNPVGVVVRRTRTGFFLFCFLNGVAARGFSHLPRRGAHHSALAAPQVPMFLWQPTHPPTPHSHTREREGEREEGGGGENTQSLTKFATTVLVLRKLDWSACTATCADADATFLEKPCLQNVVWIALAFGVTALDGDSR